MTIAISIKVNDGVVLASDSATTIIGRDPSGRTGVMKIYENANKIFNLKKERSIGVITWGAGSIGQASISTLAKDFRRLTADSGPEYHLDPDGYTIAEVAQKFKEFVFDKNYVPAFKDWKDNEKPALGFIIAGYSTGGQLAEEWRIDINNGKCDGPQQIRQLSETGITWAGMPEAIHRLVLGSGTGLQQALKEAKLDEAKIQEIINICNSFLQIPMVAPAMPIQDAIDLGIFLVETTIGFAKFAPGAPTVGGPIEVAAITKHEGFKWVRRKHYFDPVLNPSEEYTQ